MLTQRLAKYIEYDTVERFRVDFLKDMPEKTEKGEFNCTLCHTLARMFTLARNSRDMFIQTFVQKQIYSILYLIRSHQFDPVDQNHYLKVFFLLFLNRLEILPVDIQVPSDNQAEIQNVQVMRKELFVSLYMLFKIEFFPEKYLAITEDIFDTESINVIRSLVQIWHQEEAKRKQINQGRLASHVVSQVNKILVQRQAFLNIVALAANDSEINKRCIDAICADLQHCVFSQHGKLEGDLYVYQEVTIEMPH